MARQITRRVTTTTQVVQPPVPTEHPQVAFESKKTIFRTYQFIWYILSILETLLVFRILLLALGANPLSPFTDFIYLLSEPFAYPFKGVLPSTLVGTATFEWSTFIAILVYALIAYGLIELFQFIKPVTPREVDEGVKTT